jgi:hypothetical protein
MLRTTAGHVSACLNIPLEHLTIDDLVGVTPRLTKYLQGRRYERNAIRAYKNYAHVLLRKAKGLGWRPQQPEEPEVWKPILARISKCGGLRQIVYDAISNGKSPSEYADGDLDGWGTRKVEQGANHDYVYIRKRMFRRLVVQSGLQREMPNLSPPKSNKIYRIPAELFPEPLRTEFTNLKCWKTQNWAEGRGYRGRHRAVTWASFEQWICKTVGLLAQDGAAVSSLDELLSEQNVQRYVKLAQEQTRVRGDSLIRGLRLVFATAKTYPPLQDHSLPDKFGWMRSVIAQIEPDKESAKRRSKEKKWVKYSVLEGIPDMIEAEIAARPRASETWVARMRQKQLIIKWLTVLPWRQRNLREARLVSGRSDHSNIFYGEVSELTPMDLPPWAEAALNANPEEKLWQFLFHEDETKAGREARGVISSLLVPLLKQFLELHRPRLVRGIDPGTLFLNQKGRPFSNWSLCRLVANAALRYVKRRVTPHLFRDIYAVAYLRDTRDYLSLSKVLWHKNPKITIELYGRFFDESAGARVVEEWLESRQDTNKRVQAQVSEGSLGEQLRSLQVCARKKVAELDGLKGAICAIEAKMKTTSTSVSS